MPMWVECQTLEYYRLRSRRNGEPGTDDPLVKVQVVLDSFLSEVIATRPSIPVENPRALSIWPSWRVKAVFLAQKVETCVLKHASYGKDDHFDLVLACMWPKNVHNDIVAFGY